MICSTSSPKNEMRNAVSGYAGWSSTTSPGRGTCPRRAACRCDVLDVDELAKQVVAVELLADDEMDDALLVLRGRADPVDARDGGDDDDVASGDERGARGVAEPVDVVVPRGVLLDIEVGLRDVRLGLVVVVVGDEVLDGVRREELRNSLQSWAASVLLCAITSAGRWSSSITQAIVNVLPVPVAPSSDWPRFPSRSDAASCPIARGWSPVGR